MTLVRYLFETGPQDAALSNGNSGSVASSLTGGGTAVFDAAKKAHGNFGARFINAAANAAYRRWPFAAPATTWQFSGVVTLPATHPSENVSLAMFPRADGNGRLYIGVNSTGNLYVSGPGAAGITNVTSTPVTAGAKYRVTIQCAGGSTTASVVTVKVYAEAGGAWTTQHGTTWTSSTFSTGTEEVVGVDLGIASARATAYTVGWDDIQLNDGAGSEIADIVTALNTPEPVLGTVVHPTTVGGTNGSVTISWGAVSGATSFEAVKAAGASPAQGSFTVVATGVTSPYTFTGLAAGEWALGIRAKA